MVNDRSNTQELDEQTKLMYNSAIGYYHQKRLAFLGQISNKTKNQKRNDETEIKGLENTINNAMKVISESWDKIDKYIMKQIDLETRNSNSGDAAVSFQTQINNLANFIKKNQDTEQIKNKLDVSEEGANLISEIFKEETNVQNLISASQNKSKEKNMLISYDKISGYFYEEYIPLALAKIGIQIGNQANSIVNNLLTQFIRTGGVTTKGQTSVKSKKGLDISSDVGTSNMGKARFEIEVTKREHQKLMDAIEAGEDNWYSILNDNKDRKSMFGFSAKRWDLVPGVMQKYTQSAIIQNLLNKKYKSDSRGNPIKGVHRKSWNVHYAYAYMELELARYAIDLLGPTNIGVFTGKGFMWMDDFVQNITLLMNVYAKNIRYRGKNDEILPYIASSFIYIRSKKEGMIKNKNLYEKHGKGQKSYYRINLLTDITWGR